MVKLLKIEWLKIKGYNAFIILSSFFALGVITLNYVVFSVNKNMISQASASNIMGVFSPYNFDKTWQTTSYTAGFILLLPALLQIILLTNEFTYRTHRQNIIDGWSRLQFIQVKIVIALITAILSTILVFLTALTFGLFSGSSFSTYGISHIGFFFLFIFKVLSTILTLVGKFLVTAVNYQDATSRYNRSKERNSWVSGKQCRPGARGSRNRLNC